MCRHLLIMAKCQGSHGTKPSPPSRHPALDAGPRANVRSLSNQLQIQVPPCRINTLNQIKLPRPPPALQFLLSGNSLPNSLKFFEVNQPRHVILSRKRYRHFLPMLMNPLRQVIGHASVKRPVPLAGCHVHVIGHSQLCTDALAVAIS